MNVPKTFVKLDEAQIIALIESAQDWLAYLAPGISEEIASAISKRWKNMGVHQVKVVVDTDPEVIRMGYGTLEGLKTLQNAAAEIGATINQQPGLRIGVIIVDRTIFLFSPTPLLIEASNTPSFKPNAICLNILPDKLLEDIGWGMENTGKAVIGQDHVSGEELSKISKDLEQNPPQKFDIANKIRVFNSRFEFVELEVLGCSISRITAVIPPYLMAFIQDQNARENLRSSFHIVGGNSQLSGKEIERLKKRIIDSFLIVIPNYGTVVLRSKKDEFGKNVDILREQVQKFQKNIQEKLQSEIDRSRNMLFNALLPVVKQNPPSRWNKYIDNHYGDKDIENMLNRDLLSAFGTAETYIKKMEVKVLYKGVTYEMLNDPKFIAAARKAIPSLSSLFDEYDAAPAYQSRLF